MWRHKNQPGIYAIHGSYGIYQGIYLKASWKNPHQQLTIISINFCLLFQLFPILSMTNLFQLVFVAEKNKWYPLFPKEIQPNSEVPFVIPIMRKKSTIRLITIPIPSPVIEISGGLNLISHCKVDDPFNRLKSLDQSYYWVDTGIIKIIVPTQTMHWYKGNSSKSP